nr:uncharacterized protein LOC128688159 [Cherax quadricarinatus]
MDNSLPEKALSTTDDIPQLPQLNTAIETSKMGNPLPEKALSTTEDISQLPQLNTPKETSEKTQEMVKCGMCLGEMEERVWLPRSVCCNHPFCPPCVISLYKAAMTRFCPVCGALDWSVFPWAYDYPIYRVPPKQEVKEETPEMKRQRVSRSQRQRHSRPPSHHDSVFAQYLLYHVASDFYG